MYIYIPPGQKWGQLQRIYTFPSIELIDMVEHT